MAEETRNKSSDESAPAAPATGGLLRRVAAWMGSHRLQAGILLGGLLVSVGAVVGSWLYVTSNYVPPERLTLTRALGALDSGKDAEAYAMAKRLQEAGNLPYDQRGGPAFIYGVVSVREAQRAEGDPRRDFYLLASRFLEQARDQGFPPKREGQGYYLLGESLFQCGQWGPAHEALVEAVATCPEQAARIRFLLADSILRSPTPDLAEALKHNDALLADAHLAAPQQTEGLLQRARILADLRRSAECREILDRLVQADKPKAEISILQGRLLLDEACQLAAVAAAVPEETAPGEPSKTEVEPDAENRDAAAPAPEQPAADSAVQPPVPQPAAALQSIAERAPLDAAAPAQLPAEAQARFQEAIDTFRRAIGQETLESRVTPQALYLIGECYLAMGRLRDAVAQFERIRKLFPDSPEATATLLEEAEVGRRLHRADAMLARYRQALGKIDDPEQFQNPWVTLDEVRRRLSAAHQTFLKRDDYVTALAVIETGARLFSPETIVQLKAEAYQHSGEHLLALASSAPQTEADSLRRAGRKELRRAGLEWERLSELVFAERMYPEALWNAAQSYLAGRDFEGAIPVLERYLRDQARQRNALALVGLAQCHLAQGNYEKALTHCLQCIEFHPHDAAAFQSRLLASDAYLELGQVERAEAMLTENLNGDYLTPASAEWRDSLFALGRLYQATERFEDAIRKLDEAIRRYPDAPAALEARYLLADAYRATARELQNQTENSPVQATRAARLRRIRELQTSAGERFEEVRAELSRRQEERPLGDQEAAMLRNAYFALAGLQAQWEQYPKAIELYLAVANRYQNEPEVLDAYLQIAGAYRRMGEPQKTRGVAELAKAVLGRLPEDAPYTENTNRPRAEWVALFDAMAQARTTTP